jgi:Lrp/AsnC family transcriptional regulator for asnA, asnC and gidA
VLTRTLCGLAGHPLHDDGQAPRRLDDIDIKLIRLLREDGRRAFSELADTTGLPYGVVRRRCRSLLEGGFVHIAVVVDRVVLEDTVMGTVQLEIEGDVDQVLTGLSVIDGIEILFRTTGRYQGVGEVTGPSVADVVALVDGRISTVPGVRSTALHLYSSIKKLPSQWRFEG